MVGHRREPRPVARCAARDRGPRDSVGASGRSSDDASLRGPRTARRPAALARPRLLFLYCARCWRADQLPVFVSADRSPGGGRALRARATPALHGGRVHGRAISAPRHHASARDRHESPGARARLSRGDRPAQAGQRRHRRRHARQKHSHGREAPALPRRSRVVVHLCAVGPSRKARCPVRQVLDVSSRVREIGTVSAAPTGMVMHVCVCICTYRRPMLLARLLEALACQETEDAFTYSIVVADNDATRSSEPVVQAFGASAAVSVRYDVEPRRNIALARNKAIEIAKGDFIAFIDDDECPPPRWLLALFTACREYGVAGVLGPVRPRFEESPPRWVVTGKFYERPTYPTGFVIGWRQGRTGNVLLERDVFDGDTPPFRPEFLTGEDQDFFRRMIERGHRFVWCEEASVQEVVPPVRWRRTFMMRRALLRGGISLFHPTFGIRDVVKSLVAVPAYLALLPLALLLGQARFMTYVVKLCDHLGRLLALVRIKPIKQAYVIE